MTGYQAGQVVMITELALSHDSLRYGANFVSLVRPYREFMNDREPLRSPSIAEGVLAHCCLKTYRTME
jgi:hypothetical protein